MTALRPVLDAPPDGRIDPVLQQLGKLRQLLAAGGPCTGLCQARFAPQAA